LGSNKPITLLRNNTATLKATVRNARLTTRKKQRIELFAKKHHFTQKALFAQQAGSPRSKRCLPTSDVRQQAMSANKRCPPTSDVCQQAMSANKGGPANHLHQTGLSDKFPMPFLSVPQWQCLIKELNTYYFINP
jgi:hypothetical protein